MLATLLRRSEPTAEELSRGAREALERAPLTRGLSAVALDRLAQELQEQSFLPGHRVLTEGFAGQEFFIIIEGDAGVSVDGWQVAQLGPGDFFGEIALLESELRTATVVAASPMRLVVLSHWEIKRMEKRSPEAIERLHQAIEERRPPASTQAG